MRSKPVNNYRFWLIAKVVVGLLVAMQPAEATSKEIKPDFSRDLDPSALALPDPSLAVTDTQTFSTDSLDKLTDASISKAFDVQKLELAQVPFPGTGRAPQSSPPVMVPNPEIIIKSNGTGNPDILSPTVPVAPVLPRAVAPPVGDMSISNINTTYDSINLGQRGSTMIPRLVLRQAPVKEVLLVLARYAGMNIIFTDGSGAGLGTPGAAPAPGVVTSPTAQTTISLDLERESVQQVFNAVLMVSGLKANLRGSTVFVGPDLPPQAMNLVSRTIRLNQVKSFNAGVTLSAQGAEFQRLVTKTEDITDPLTGRVTGKRELPSQLEAIKVAASAGGSAPLLLNGLRISTDDRLNSITLVGEPRQVEIASSLLTQLDARRRQVAVNVKIVDINLNNIQDYNSSFSFGSGDFTFIQDNGAAVMRIGETAPITRADANSASGRISNPITIPNPFEESTTFLLPNSTFGVPGYGEGIFGVDEVTGAAGYILPRGVAEFFSGVAGVSGNPFLAGLTDLTLPEDTIITRTLDGTTVSRGTPAEATVGLPSYFQYPKRFQAQVEAQIRSGNAKILTDPTLMVQEGQQAQVKLTQSVISSIDTQVDPLSGVRTTTPVLSDVGLTLLVNVDSIDDNGFISMTVAPTVASPGGTQRFESGPGANNTITLINKRELTSGLVRLRDGQTLILSGIISEIDQTITSKVPILGDIPIIGALFRSQTDSTDRSEVIVMLTPQIVSDGSESQFGYNFTPGKATSEYLRKQGFPAQALP